MSGPETVPGVPSMPPGLRFDHFAFATPRIPDLLPLYIDALGGTFRRMATTERKSAAPYGRRR